jgi:hypothetical protein
MKLPPDPYAGRSNEEKVDGGTCSTEAFAA